jgi:hypothetical protein
MGLGTMTFRRTRIMFGTGRDAVCAGRVTDDRSPSGIARERRLP